MGRRSWLLALGTTGLAAGAFLLGPRARVEDDPLPEPAMPDDLRELENWLKRREAAIPGIVAGAEKRIRWRDGATRTATSVVYLHGFSSTRQETAPLAEEVAAGLGANLFETRLRGHGRDGAALARATADEWLEDTREAHGVARRIGERAVIIAASTGAGLALWQAATGPRPPFALVLISPNFGPVASSSELLLWPWARAWIPWVAGERREWEPVNELQGKYWTTSYPIEALFPMMATVELARTIEPERIRSPVLVIHSNDDPVVSPQKTEAWFDHLVASSDLPHRKVVVQGAGDPHVLAGRILSPGKTAQVRTAILDFVREVAHSESGD